MLEYNEVSPVVPPAGRRLESVWQCWRLGWVCVGGSSNWRGGRRWLAVGAAGGRPQPWRGLCPSCWRPDRRCEGWPAPGCRPAGARLPCCLCAGLEGWQPCWLRMLQLSSNTRLPDLALWRVEPGWQAGALQDRQDTGRPYISPPSSSSSSQRSVLPSEILRTLLPSPPSSSLLLPPPRIFPG